MSKRLILVTGANGQLGKEFRAVALLETGFEFAFVSKDELPIHDFEKVRDYFAMHRPAFCINCAAYTAVDKAESEKELAFLINAEAVSVLAEVSKQYGTAFVHISTDYVFKGDSPHPYKEDAETGPISVYGSSKLKGESMSMEKNPDSIIIRTAWVYSEFGNNFVKTMIKLMKERKELNVVNDQIGAPTYAADLAKAIMTIIKSKKWQAGIYHFSNSGKISWYDFAIAIKEITGSDCKVNPIPTSDYPTPAKRPAFSLLDTNKISKTYGVTIPEWKASLIKCIDHLKQAS
jgi:dTDP-4-dehydrorhamnose reductase